VRGDDGTSRVAVTKPLVTSEGRRRMNGIAGAFGQQSPGEKLLYAMLMS
jgi:hypothetical protein